MLCKLKNVFHHDQSIQSYHCGTKISNIEFSVLSRRVRSSYFSAFAVLLFPLFTQISKAVKKLKKVVRTTNYHISDKEIE